MLWNLLAIVLLIALSAFFSGTEMGYASANELRLRNAAENGGKRQKLAYWISQRYDRAITTLLLGNNLVNTASSSISTVIVITLLGDGYAWVATLVMTILLLMFGEIMPKVIAKSAPEKVAGGAAYPLRALMWVFAPITFAVQWLIGHVSKLWKGREAQGPAVTEDDLEVLFDTAEDEGSLDGNTTDLLMSALDFDDVMAYEIITPRVDMAAIDIGDPIEDIITQAIGATFSRMPVYEDSKDNIIGVLHVTRFLKHLVDDPHPDVRSLLLPACYVPRTAVLPAVLATMRQQKCHLVIVGDEFGGTLGILTMEDVLEELVGDIWDETDVIDAPLTLLPDGRYEASGALRVSDLFDSLGIDERDFPYESTTLGGWATEMLGATPTAGAHFDYKRVRVTIGRMHKRRVSHVFISMPDEAAQGADEAAAS